MAAHNSAKTRWKTTFTTRSAVMLLRVVVLWTLVGMVSGQGFETDLVFTVNEGEQAGYLVGSISTEPGYVYSFSDAPAEFNLNSDSGEIRTAVEIDREQLPDDVFDLLVLATSNSRTKPIELRIIVADLNDNSPAFPESDTAIMFTENGRVGSQVILESATDPDKAGNGNIVEYSISEGNVENAFRLMVIPGPDGLPIYIHLETAFSLDHEMQDFYQLTIAARDDGTPARYGFLRLNISVVDINDNPPIFDQSTFVISINESTPAGTRLIEVHATDGDSGLNGQVEYFIDEDTTNFNIDPVSGNVTLQRKLNYVSSDPYQVTLKVRDKGQPTLYGRAFLTVYVIDENDHDPEITFGYFPETAITATVTEGVATNSIVALVTVTDEDLAENGEVNLEVISGNELGHFSLEPLTLSFPGFNQVNIFRVLVVGEVDRETIAQYNFTLMAWDNGSPRRQTVAHLVIRVVDANDHPPEFQQSEYQASLSEAEPIGSFVESLTASDADFGPNAMIAYSIASGNDRQWFEIDADTGLVTTQARLNREEASLVVLNISAIDGGTPPMASKTTLTITILDENDEVPTFASSVYNASVPENVDGGVEVTTVTAVDGDEGTSGFVRYAFTDDVGHQYPGMFSIDTVSGVISAEVALDRESVAEYDLQVRAFDGGDPPLESFVSVHIDVVDENDNVPVFYPQTYLASVVENDPAVTYVVRVSATDLDNSNYGNLTYSITGGNSLGKFQIDGTTGIISTMSPLDREDQSAYTLSITATDGGGRTTATAAVVRITVDDIQDNPPTFDMPVYEFEILENADSTSFVGRVTASSQDLNSEITYIIFSGDPNGLFEVDSDTGVIRTTSELDRESIPSYELVVYANGGIMFGSATVRVNLIDVNDNAPKFLRSTVTVDVVENWEVQRHFYQVQATDEDSPPNGIVVYDILQNPDNTFGINHTNGWLFLNKDLQDSSQDEYLVQILASDLGTPRLSTMLDLIITVRDVNNHAPEFVAEHFETSISETTEVNRRFFSLTATDSDQGTNGDITYRIQSGNVRDSFGVFPDGQVFVKNFLDREQTSEYTLVVNASDNGIPPRSALTELLVEILDENDNRPFFENSSYTFYLPEGSLINSVVGAIFATDNDLGVNAELTYSFAENQTRFSLDRKTGIITNLVGFDREMLKAEMGNSRFVLEAVVRDGGAITFQDRTTVTIVISDINDNAPIFALPSYQATISELAENGTHVLRVAADDADSGDNSYLIFSIVDGNEEGRFRIGRTSGQVTLISPLNREMTSEYTLTIKAQDAGTIPESTMVEVQIEVLDENDHEPIFTHVVPELEVTECLEIGQPITMVSATDVDIGENGLISYSITGGDIQKAFRIDPDNGQVTLSKLLDHETTSTYTLNITARDSGVPRLTSITSVLVHVRDCNDNSPVFPQNSVVQWIDEEIPINTHVVTVMASDPDSGINGQVRYSIISQEPEGEHFSINPDSGRIVTNARIDHEYLKVHSGVFKLNVRATDQALPRDSRRSATTEIVIFVRDINDNAPVFQTHNAVVISRSAPAGTQVTTVSANDPDDGQNGQVTYALINRSVPFEIDMATGEVTLTRNIESSVLSYTLNINAEDGGQIPERTSSEVTVLVIDDSDNGPAFAQNVYSGTVAENQDVGTEVVTIAAGYQDDPGANIEYYISSVTSGGVSKEGDFRMMTSSGVISTGVVLDRELLDPISQYAVTVYAIDKDASTPRTRSTQVMITVLDENDSPPTFDLALYHANVSEEAPSGSPVLRLVARDADIGSNAQVAYSIVSGNDGHFVVDPSTGQIRTSGRLDRESMAVYQLGVRASDGRQSTVTLLAVSVQDANDNDPVFTETSYSFGIPEDQVVGTIVNAVSAVDQDAGSNGAVVYSIVNEGSPGEDIFGLNSQTGEFTLLADLDFEQKQVYFLTVLAEDRGTIPRSSQATVYFNILDVNDNDPVFDPANYPVDVAEDVAMGTAIVAVMATDADSGSNAEMVYSISSGDPTGHFTIHPNGTITNRRELDRETQSFFNLEIMATDQAQELTQRRSGKAQVRIFILDINDNAPAFTTAGHVWVREDTDIGQVVMFVHAQDADSGRNSYIEYSLSPDAGGTFSVDPSEGNIRLLQTLDRETMDEYMVTVHATDNGQPPHSTSMDVLIQVSDVNDNKPVFSVDNYHASLPEDTPLGLEFLQVIATDADEGVNAELRFSIISGNYDSDFSVDSIAGVLSVANALDRERRASYMLTVRAQDSGDGSRVAQTTVTITVQDINDNAPAFLVPYAPEIDENNAPGALVTQVSATDEDEGSNGQLSYRIRGNDYDGLFTLGRDTGEIRVGALLDREEEATYSLSVVAQDAGNPSREGRTEVVITVVDLNDNRPQFEFASYSVTLTEEVSSNTPVLQVTAQDADSTADLRYRLDSSIGNKFTVQPITGEILTSTGRLDREQQDTYHFVVTAEDGQAWTSQTDVIVILQDINDNPPLFDTQVYQALLPATTATGTFVVAAEATDADIGDNARLTYAITNGDTSKFTIDPATGFVQTAQPLTTESGTYSLDISASDGASTATTTVQITFDSSGQFPAFQSPSSGSLYAFDEDVATNIQVVMVQATSPKTGSEGSVTYHIVGGNAGDTLNLDAQSGSLAIVKDLDHEVYQRFSLLIEARDGSTPPLRSFLDVTVNVNDLNDNAPVFDQVSYTGQVREGRSSGTDVVQVLATDADSGLFGNVIYSLRADGNTNNNFRIDPSTGLLQTNKVLDRETISDYTLTVQADDQGSPSKSTQITVHVTVGDVNDNELVFTNLFSATVPEDAPLDTEVITITTSDPDTINDISYLIIGDETAFAIDSVTGKIRVNGTLDREETGQYQLLVSAGDESFVKDTTVTITVSDVNDNAPSFAQQSYSISLPEGLSTGSLAVQVSASDEDVGPNEDIYYTLKTMSKHFIIDEDTGYITIKEPVDYIQHSGTPDPNVYLLEVLARDRGVPSLYAEVPVTLTIYDANKYAPVFQEAGYFSPVPSTVAVDVDILQVIATETLDQGQNAQIQYTVIGGNGSSRFDVDQDSGWISVKANLQADLGSYLSIIVEAKDQGRPSPMSAQVTVQLLITGTNDHTPSFDDSTYQVSVQEDLSVGSEVMLLTANDDDSGVNGMLLYSIVSGNQAGLFAIEEETGSVIVAAALDYEASLSHTMQIKVRDQGWQSKESSTVLTVNLLDVNDNPPVFQPNLYHPQVAENSPSATYVTTVTATDADTGANAAFTYDIIGGSGKDLFSIAPDTGVIRTQGSLDYEGSVKVFELSVEATNDDISMFGIAHVTVQLTGVNEYYPHFVESSYQFSVSEAAADGFVIGMVFASDADQGHDGQVYYLLVGSSNREGFAIDSRTGEIVVSKAHGELDREKLDTIVLSVLARNDEPISGDNVDEVLVTVSILDANDPPQFLDELYTAKVSEEDSVGTYVTTVTALEFDQSYDFRQFSYAILEGNLMGAFQIDPVSGSITVASMLDRETTAEYRLKVGAVDTGSPPKTGYTDVVITIEDVNDNGPVFLPGNDVGSVPENEATNTIVMRLNATDPDLNSDPALFTFYLLPNEDSPSFTLDRSTGILRTTRTLDREAQSDYYLSVECRDGAVPEMLAVSTIHVIVQDRNDNPSSARDARIEVKAYQSVFPGGTIGVVRPIDLDTGDVFICQIVSGDTNVFSIQPGCQLTSRMHSTEADYALEITGDDGQHSSILSDFQVTFRAFDNDSLSNSIVLRLFDTSPETFLSDYYDRFIASVSSFLGNRESLLILGVKAVLDDADRMDLILAIRRDSGHLLREDTAKLIEDNRATITSQSGVTIDVVDHSPCDPNPCQNSGTCTDRMQLTQTSTITDSPSVVFVAPRVERVFQCACQSEFFGPLCQDQIDQCTPEPCLNGGICTDLIGDFQCSCPPGFTGKRCDTDIDDCLSSPCLNNGQCEDLEDGYTCHCSPGYTGQNCQNGPCSAQPCLNGGTCVEHATGYRCECSYGETGDNCGITSVGFQQGSYMEFPPLSATQNIITLHFTTVSANALLIYNHDGTTDSNADFLTLEMASGQLRLSYNLGDGVVVVSTTKKINDGQWHKVEARRVGKEGKLIVDDCPSSQPAGFCRATAQGGSQTMLDLNGEHMNLGGTASIDAILSRPWQVSSADFLGCLRDLHMDGQTVDLTSPLVQRGTTLGCDRDTQTCSSSSSEQVCGGSGECIDEWWSHWCQCPEGAVGDSCNEVPIPFSFGSGSYVEYVVKESYQRQQLLEAAKASSGRKRRRRRRDTTPDSQTISMTFRTGSADGLLLLVESGADFTTLQVVGRSVQYNYGSSGQTKGVISLGEVVTDWKWRTLTLYREGATITLEVEDETKSQRFDAVPHDFSGLQVSGMSLGGTKAPLLIDGEDVKAFSGCLEDFAINGAALPLEGASDMFEAVPSENAGEGCDAVDLCSPNPCPDNQVCTVDQEAGVHVCSCQEGYKGDDCKTPIVGGQSSNSLLIALVSVFTVVLVVILVGCLLLLCRYRNKAKKAKEIAVNSKQNLSMDSLDNAGFSADTFDNPTMIGSQQGKAVLGTEVVRQQPDIIEQNAYADNPPASLILDTDEVVIGEEASGRGHEALEHYDLENASSIAPSDIEPAYHYRYYHDGREKKQKRHGYRYSPNPMLARIGTPPCESPVSQVSSANHLSIAHNPNPNSLHVRASPVVGLQHSTPIERSTPANDLHLSRQSPGLLAMRQSPALHLLKKEAARSVTPLHMGRANTPVRNIASPVGSEHSYNQSELRSQGHHSDVSSRHSTKGSSTHISPAKKIIAHRPPRPPSAMKEVSPSDPKRPMGLTVEEVKRLNTARPDLMTGSHASTIDNLSSVGSSKQRQRHLVNLPPLPSDLEPSPLLEPPESSSDDDMGGSFTCSELDSDTEKHKAARAVDPTVLLLSRLSNMNDGGAEEEEEEEAEDEEEGGKKERGETYEQFSAPFHQKKGLDSVGGSLSTLFASEDETADPKGTNGQFSWDQFLNWGPRFETLEGVFVDIAQLQDNIHNPAKTKVFLEQTAEEFV